MANNASGATVRAKNPITIHADDFRASYDLSMTSADKGERFTRLFLHAEALGHILHRQDFPDLADEIQIGLGRLMSDLLCECRHILSAADGTEVVA